MNVHFTESRWCVYVDGAGASRLLRQVRNGIAPEWDRKRRRYVVTERVAADLLALAELEHRNVVVTGRSETEAATQGGLW